jgi:hypothetical protein
MTVIETINRHLVTLSLERQAEALDFVLFLKERQSRAARATGAESPRSLCTHPAFGSWRGRNVDALAYEQALRSEWHDGA